MLKIPFTRSYDRLKEVLADLGQRQLTFICEKCRFLRGGIAVGTGYSDPNNPNSVFVGNGLARAVKMEGKHVNWPIIGTIRKTLEEIQKCNNIKDPEELFGLSSCFNKQGEEVFFIDFIKGCLESDLVKYYNILKSKMLDNRLSCEIKAKYIWLLRYYYHHFEKIEEIERVAGFIL